MMHLFLDNRPWFRAKRIGIGAGLPIAWQGWALIAAHIALLAGIARLLTGEPVLLALPLLVAIALAPMPLYRAKTEGGWHWRWPGGGKRGGKRP